jgi:hypothetical protein
MRLGVNFDLHCGASLVAEPDDAHLTLSLSRPARARPRALVLRELAAAHTRV